MKTTKQAIGDRTANPTALEAQKSGFAFTHTGMKPPASAALEQPFHGSRVVNYRKTPDLMAAELEQLLAQPYARIGLVSLLDKIERMGGGAGAAVDQIERMVGHVGAAVSLPDLLTQGVPAVAAMADVTADLLRLAVKDGLLEQGRLPGRERTKTFTLLDKGRLMLKKAREARLALWKVNPRMDIREICIIVENEEADGVEMYLSDIVMKAANVQTPQPIQSAHDLNPLWAATTCWMRSRPVKSSRAQRDRAC